MIPTEHVELRCLACKEYLARSFSLHKYALCFPVPLSFPLYVSTCTYSTCPVLHETTCKTVQSVLDFVLPLLLSSPTPPATLHLHSHIPPSSLTPICFHPRFRLRRLVFTFDCPHLLASYSCPHGQRRLLYLENSATYVPSLGTPILLPFTAPSPWMLPLRAHRL